MVPKFRTPQYIHNIRNQVQADSTEFISRALLTRKVGTVILPAAFTDHHTVVFSIKTEKIPEEPKEMKDEPDDSQ
jgi:hypothetical protein